MKEIQEKIDQERPANPIGGFDIGYNNGLTMAVAIMIGEGCKTNEGKLLNKSTEEIAQFLYRVSHSLSKPLNAEQVYKWLKAQPDSGEKLWE